MGPSFETRGVYHRAQLRPEGRDQNWAARNPLQRVGEYRELADLASFLVSDSAGYIMARWWCRTVARIYAVPAPEDLLAWTDAQ
jgi:NAD(P)-dependent dehydrogenase (short-subunit alcohol dehydrogenase family)